MRPWYETILAWTHARLGTERPLVLGISGPQGGGKSTLAAALVDALCNEGLRALGFSTDDCYLTRTAQLQVSEAHPGNRALAQRGYPGTHDVALGTAVLEALRAGRPTAIPQYDKSAHDGLGDRTPECRWRRVTERQDVVIFEGWTLGFAPVPVPADSMLHAPNERLAAYAPWTAALDALVLLEAEAPELIVRWRVESERARRERGEPTMSEADATDYIERCLPAYACWVPPMLAQPPVPAFLHVVLGPDRQPLAQGTRGAPSIRMSSK